MPGVGGDCSVTEARCSHQVPANGAAGIGNRACQAAIADALKFSVPARDGQPDLDVNIFVDRKCHPADVNLDSAGSDQTSQVRQRRCRGARWVGVNVSPGCNVLKNFFEGNFRARRIRHGLRRSKNNSRE
jgi:hypothetical protein